jgi:hypothetical protein
MKITMRGVCELRRLGEFSWHDIHINFYDDQLRQSCNTWGITSTILEATLLVLLFNGIYGIRS